MGMYPPHTPFSSQPLWSLGVTLYMPHATTGFVFKLSSESSMTWQNRLTISFVRGSLTIGDLRIGDLSKVTQRQNLNSDF